MKIIFAQGNPEPDYTDTRHNIGFNVLNIIADQLEVKWTASSKFNAYTAEATIANEKVLLVKPTTFYNETGLSARKLIDFYKLDPSKDILVIHDELALPFGVIRIRDRGSDAGNNGIKSLNDHIGQEFMRIRIGIHNDFRDRIGDAGFVLAKFKTDEAQLLKENIIPQVVKIIEQFCTSDISITSQNTL